MGTGALGQEADWTRKLHDSIEEERKTSTEKETGFQKKGEASRASRCQEGRGWWLKDAVGHVWSSRDSDSELVLYKHRERFGGIRGEEAHEGRPESRASSPSSGLTTSLPTDRGYVEFISD